MSEKDRVFRMAAKVGAGFFGERTPGLTVDLGHYEWRMAPEAHDSLLAEVRPEWIGLGSMPGERLLGIPVVVDNTLPPTGIELRSLRW